jgi:predicted nuclease of restriction endonuclease-like (RecB) superfamily
MSQSTTYYIDAIKQIKQAILSSRYRAAALVNREMLSLYFGIGGYISANSRKGTWGTNAIEVISEQLQQELPGLRGFSATNMKRMRLFYETWSDAIAQLSDKFRPLLADEIHSIGNEENTNRPLMAGDLRTKEIPIHQLLSDDLDNETLSPFLQIGFTHHCEIIEKTNSIEERIFYINSCAKGFWSKEKLRYNLKANLYHEQGTMLNNFAKTISDIDLRGAALRSFKDEYLMDYINIEDPDEADEREIENEILRHIRKVIMTFGADFSFIGNQYRLQVGEEEFFIDLLFFNRRLQSLVAVELKRGKFKAEYLGKMNLYLSALDSYVKQPHENPSIGIILCKEKNNTIVEFAFRDFTKPMGVATYKTSAELPEKYRDALPSPEMLKEVLK